MATAVVITCLFAVAESASRETSAQVNAVAAANNEFTKRIYNHLVASKDDRNIIFSPYSVSSVMAMAMAGANGRTKDQIRSGMSFPSEQEVLEGYSGVTDALNAQQSEGFTLKTANRMFVEETLGLLPSFRRVTQDFFRAPVQSVDFVRNPEAARVNINDWVEGQTNNKIQELLPPGSLDPLTRLVLVNAVYFKGTWLYQFDPQLTTERTFYAAPGQESQVDMMYAEIDRVRMRNVRELNARALELPYKTRRLSMIVLLPNDRYGLGQMEQKLSGFDLHGFRFDSAGEAHVSLPKFRVETTHDLKEPLESLGVTDIFDSRLADLSGINGGRDLYGSFIVQKAFIEVNEEGSEAAAATGFGVTTFSLPSPPEVFDCDHPFMVFIKDNLTGMILFNGRVTNPAL